MSYLAHKSRLFRDAGDAPELIRKRSEGRMKTYPSTIDARAWCVDGEDRRQHILDLIRADHEKCALGKYVPIEVLIDTLLANKNADIARLREQVEELQRLLDMYSKLDLTEDQKRMLAGMQQEMGKAGEELDDIAERSGSKTLQTSRRAAGLGESEEGETAEETEGETGAETGESVGGGTDLELAGTDLETEGELTEGETEGGETGETDSTAGGTQQDVASRSGCSALSRSVCSAVQKEARAGAVETAALVSYDGYSQEELKALVINKDAEIISLKNALAAKQAECDQQNKIARTAIEQLETLKDIMEERDSLKQQLEESLHELQTLRNRIEDPCVAEIAALETEIERLRSSGQLSPDEEAEVIRKEVEVLKKYCAKLSSIQEENNRLKAQVDRLQELSGIPKDPEDDSDIPDDPSELKSRFKDLRRKFAKLTEIMNERDKYKIRVQQLEAELLNYGDLPEEIELFKQRSQMLDDVLDERDNLQKRLEKVKGIEEELVALKRKADRVDELERQLDAMNAEVGNVRRSSALELQSLKSQRDESTRELDNIKAERDMLRMKAADMATVDEELERLRYRAKEAEVLRIERDRMKVRLDELAAIEVEYMQLLDKTRCIETIKAEREMYKQKYEELLGLECECDMLRAQVERFKQLDKEREALLRQVRDCECCIADQEDEIKRLVTHIDRMSQGSHQQQDRMQKALSDMRAELEQKTSLIATSEEQLAGVQDQLKNTIAGVSCETTCLRARIEELESELEAANASLKEKQDEIDSLKASLGEKDGLIHSLSAERRSTVELQNAVASKDALIAQLQKDLEEKTSESEKMGDEHFEKMLRESKCAVTRVAEELGKHYEEWDCMQGRIGDEDQDLFAKYTEERRTSLKLSNDVDELQERVRQLEAELAKANDTVAKLRDELGGADRLSAENKALRRHSTEVQEVAKEQIEELADHLKKAKERIAELEAQNAALMEASGLETPPAVVVPSGGDNCDELKQQIDDLEMERGKLEKLVQQFQSDQAAGGPDIGALRMELANMEEQLQKETTLRQTAEENLKAAEERIANLTKELNSLTDNIQEKVRRSSIAETELEAELLKLRSENEQLKENMKSVGDSAARRTSQVEGEVEVLADQNKQILKEKVALESENASLTQQLADLKQQLENLRSGSGDTAELDALRQEKEALLAQIEAQKNEINDMIQKINSGASPADINQEQLEKERKEKEELQNMIQSLQDQISGMEQGEVSLPPVASESSAVNAAIAKLTAQLEQEQAKASACEEALKKLQDESGGASPASGGAPPASGDDSALLDEISNLKQRIADLEGENTQLKASGDDSALLDEISNLKQRIADLERENTQLKASASGDDSGLLEEIANLKGRVKELEDENAQLKTSASGAVAGSVASVSRSARPDVDLLNEEIAMLKNKVNELETQNEQLALAAAGDDTVLFSQINDLKQKIKDLEVENMELKGKLSRMQSEMSGLRRMSKEMQSDHVVQIKRLSKSFEERMKKSSASIKMLEEAMNLSEEDQAALQKMKETYENHIKSLEEELARQQKECGDTIATLKAQYDRDVKNINNKYNDGIAKLQGSHEEILKDVSKEHEREVESLRKELRTSKEAIETLEKQKTQYSQRLSVTREVGPGRGSLTVKTVENVNIKPTTKGICTCGSGFENILQKILKDGIESLTYEELQFMHTKTCDATAAVLGKRPGGARLPSLQPAAPIMPKMELLPPMDIDKLSLMRRVSGLEGDLMRKQKQAQQKVGALQIAVRMEKQRLEELKRTLEIEKQRNCELMCKIGAQSRTVSNLQVERDMMRKQSSFHEEKVQELMGSVEDERAHVRHLEDDLHQARQRHKKDSEALESMRIKLEKSLNNEMVLKMQLEQHAQGSSPRRPSPCPCRHALAAAQQDQPRGQPPQSHTQSFYTELTVQDVRNKRNFVHHCCMKHRDQTSAGSDKSKKSCPGQPSPRRTLETDE